MFSPDSLNYRLRGALKRAARKLGLDIQTTRDPLAFLVRRNIRTVLDIGANGGQFAKEVRSTLPTAMIFSFEPLPGPYAQLCKVMGGDARFKAFQIALGSHNGVAEFEENEFSPSSSLLPIAPRSIEAWPVTRVTRKTMVDVQTLDSWAAQHHIEGRYLVKLDVQGYEDKVIDSGRKVIRNAAVVLSEVSFVQLYTGQALFDSINGQMVELGFRLHGMIGNGYEPATGDMLSADAIFIPSDD